MTNKSMDMFSQEQQPIPLDMQRVRDMILDKMLADFAVYCPAEIHNKVEHFRQMLDSIEGIAQDVAIACVANRHLLSPLKTFDSVIDGDPVNDKGGQLYELGYRVVEQVGDNPPHLDQVLTLKEAVDQYGMEAVEANWGVLGNQGVTRKTDVRGYVTTFSTSRLPAQTLSIGTSQDLPKPR